MAKEQKAKHSATERSETAPQVNYEQAMRQLEEIVRKLENDELDIDQMTVQLRTAQQLIKLCTDKLTKTDEEIKKILK
jgi:exodeoxyribonuclease VII small subunit